AKHTIVNSYALLLECLRNDPYVGVLGAALLALGQGIRSSSLAIIKAQEAFGEDADPFVDDECDIIEDLLGAGFVCIQKRITYTVTRVQRLHELASRRSMSLTTTAKRRESIMTFGSPYVGGSAYTEIQVLDALANYFKHE